MWIILFAFLLLFLLVFMNTKREWFNTAQLLNIYNILTDKSTTGSEKIKRLEDPSVIINDSIIRNILKSTSFSDNEKLIKIFEYFDELIDKRNKKKTYKRNKIFINFDNLFNIIKIVQSSDFDTETEKILEIKKLGLIDDYFDAVLNSNLSDKLKLINEEDSAQPSIQNLINEIIFPV